MCFSELKLCVVYRNTQCCLPRKMTECHYGHLTEPVSTMLLSPCTSTLCMPAWQHPTSSTNITSPCTRYIHSELHPVLFKRCPESIAFQIHIFHSLMQCSQQALIKPSRFQGGRQRTMVYSRDRVTKAWWMGRIMSANHRAGMGGLTVRETMSNPS